MITPSGVGAQSSAICKASAKYSPSVPASRLSNTGVSPFTAPHSASWLVHQPASDPSRTPPGPPRARRSRRAGADGSARAGQRPRPEPGTRRPCAPPPVPERHRSQGGTAGRTRAGSVAASRSIRAPRPSASPASTVDSVDDVRMARLSAEAGVCIAFSRKRPLHPLNCTDATGQHPHAKIRENLKEARTMRSGPSYVLLLGAAGADVARCLLRPLPARRLRPPHPDRGQLLHPLR